MIRNVFCSAVLIAGFVGCEFNTGIDNLFRDGVEGQIYSDCIDSTGEYYRIPYDSRMEKIDVQVKEKSDLLWKDVDFMTVESFVYIPKNLVQVGFEYRFTYE